VAVGGDLKKATLLEAYHLGIFPWPQANLPILWFSPDPRGILFFAQMKWPKSFLKWLKKTPYRITINQKFESVIRACAETPRPGQSGTWITPEVIEGYKELHREGFAHSIECWDELGHLVGGMYGVFVEGVFAGESMFFRKDNASKFCLWWLTEQLKSQGFDWMDTQMVTSLLWDIGGVEVERNYFLDLLLETQKRHSNKTLVLKNYP
jgi:leucyl/phenylalanyl-tRNA---protein transferase